MSPLNSFFFAHGGDGMSERTGQRVQVLIAQTFSSLCSLFDATAATVPCFYHYELGNPRNLPAGRYNLIRNVALSSIVEQSTPSGKAVTLYDWLRVFDPNSINTEIRGILSGKYSETLEIDRRRRAEEQERYFAESTNPLLGRLFDAVQAERTKRPRQIFLIGEELPFEAWLYHIRYEISALAATQCIKQGFIDEAFKFKIKHAQAFLEYVKIRDAAVTAKVWELMQKHPEYLHILLRGSSHQPFIMQMISAYPISVEPNRFALSDISSDPFSLYLQSGALEPSTEANRKAALQWFISDYTGDGVFEDEVNKAVLSLQMRELEDWYANCAKQVGIADEDDLKLATISWLCRMRGLSMELFI